jgi:Flp pilus assembly pilin Flp
MEPDSVRTIMTTIATLFQWARQFRTDQRGQDLIEYALVAALVVVAVVSGLAPWVGPSLSQIFSKVISVLKSPS